MTSTPSIVGHCNGCIFKDLAKPVRGRLDVPGLGPLLLLLIDGLGLMKLGSERFGRLLA